jgi:hypothetical protein
VVTFHLITGHDSLAAHLHRLSSYPSPVCVLCSEENSISNKDHLKECTILNTENIIVKIYWDARRQMEFPLVPTTANDL